MMLQQRIYLVIAKHVDVICNRVRAKWGNMAGIKGNAEIDAMLPQVVGGIVMTTIKASGQKAWIAEFGSGSLMDGSDENPWLNEYRSNPNYNWLRGSDNAITGRMKGKYKDLDGNTQTSTGNSAGRDLELKPVYTVMYPAHVIQDEINGVIPDIIADIASEVETEFIQTMTLEVKMIL